MDVLFVALHWLVFGVVFGAGAVLIALRKRRNAVGWGLATLVVPLAVLVLILLPPRPYKDCDYCRIEVEGD